jgi:hypothetical protein
MTSLNSHKVRAEMWLDISWKNNSASSYCWFCRRGCSRLTRLLCLRITFLKAEARLVTTDYRGNTNFSSDTEHSQREGLWKLLSRMREEKSTTAFPVPICAAETVSKPRKNLMRCITQRRHSVKDRAQLFVFDFDGSVSVVENGKK